MTGEISLVATYGLTTLTKIKLFTLVWLFGEVMIITLLFTVRSRKVMRISLLVVSMLIISAVRNR